MPRSEPGRIAVTEFMSGGGELGALMRATTGRDAARAARDVAAEPAHRRADHARLRATRCGWAGAPSSPSSTTTPTGRPSACKHPWALGRPAREVWREIWPDIGPRIDHVLRTGEGDLGRRRCCCSWSAAAIPRRPTTPSPTARCPTTTARSAACSASSPKRPSASSASAGCAAARAGRRRSPRRATADEVFDARRPALPRDASARPALHADSTCSSDDGKRARLVVEQRHRRGPSGRRPQSLTVDDCRALADRRRAAQHARADARRRSRGTIRAHCRPAPGTRRRAGDGLLPIAQQGQTSRAGVFIAGTQPVSPVRRRAIAASSIWSPARSPPASPTRAPTRTSGAAPRRWPRSTAPRRRSSPTSATSSARR